MGELIRFSDLKEGSKLDICTRRGTIIKLRVSGVLEGGGDPCGQPALVVDILSVSTGDDYFNSHEPAVLKLIKLEGSFGPDLMPAFETNCLNYWEPGCVGLLTQGKSHGLLEIGTFTPEG